MEKERKYYIGADEVMNITEVSRTTAYKIIKNLNETLQKEQKKIVIAGKVPRALFFEKMGLEDK